MMETVNPVNTIKESLYNEDNYLYSLNLIEAFFRLQKTEHLFIFYLKTLEFPAILFRLQAIYKSMKVQKVKLFLFPGYPS